MAADQRKKRLGAANVFGYSSREPYREKKKHLSSTQFDLNWKLNSHASLKWDYNEKRAVAKEEQVGLAKSDLIPFKASVARHKDSLADVLTAPKDVFELDDLADVLSFEAWESLLTEKERNFLAHFLPRGVSPDQVVEDLLAGENFHFGNPFVKWSSSLCSGELRPEAVLRHEESCRADKKAYYSELQKYHDNMIRNLQKLKDRCATTNDPKAEIEKMTRRLRKQPSKNFTLSANEVRYRNREHSTPEEKASSSDSQKFFKENGLELSRRWSNSKETVKYKDGRPAGSLDMMKVASKSKKREKLQKANVNHGDGSKYMSYVKISKSQHELVRSMKQSGNSIQSKALNRVFGNITDFNVKPFVIFEEEEEKRIHEHWSNLARKDIPSAFLNWGKIQSERGQVMESLCLEIEEKLKHLMEEEETGNFDASEDESRHSDDSQQTNEDDAPSAGPTSDDDQDSEPPFIKEKASVRMPALAVNQEGHPMDLNEEDSHISPKSNNATSVKSQSPVTVEAGEESPGAPVFPDKRSALSVMANNEFPQPPATRDPWPAIAMLESSCGPSAMDFASCSELPLKHPQVGEDQSCMHLVNSSKGLLPQQTDQLPFFGSYQNNEQHDLLHTIVKHDNYHQVPKKTQLGFQPTTTLLMDSTQFSGHSREQLLPSFPFDPRQRAPNDFFMHHNIQENMYPDNSRFSIPRPPEQYPSTNMRDWSTPSRFPAPMHSRLGNPMELPNHNWFSVEARAQPSWSGPEVFPNPNPSLGSGSGGDQSLFSVLSQCSNLNPGAPTFSAVGTAGKFMPTGSFPEDLGVGISRTNSLHQPPAPSPLDYLSGHNVASSTLKTSDMGWINLPHQPSSLHDPTAKPYPKSWEQ